MSMLLFFFFDSVTVPPTPFPGIMRMVNIEVKESTLINISLVRSDAI